MNSTVTLIVDQVPFPPRNGVTIPVCGLIGLLRSRGFRINVVVLRSSFEITEEMINANRECLDSIIVVERKRLGKILSLLGELFLIRPIFHAWRYPNPDRLRAAIANSDYVIASPISVLDAAVRFLGNDQVLVGAISDCYTSVVRGRSNGLLSGITSRVRARWIRVLEARILSKCSSVLVQTEVDRSNVEKILRDSSEIRKVFVCPNGVQDEFFSVVRRQAPRSVVLAVADLTGEGMRENMQWFLEACWPSVLKRVPSACFKLVGKGIELDSDLGRVIEEEGSVTYCGFVPDLGKYYEEAKVSIAPIFKGYGFINKVAEAMAAGVPVVGDEAAFNGMESVLDLQAGVAAEKDRFADAVVSVLTLSDEDWFEASDAAREFAAASLAWESRWPVLRKALNFGRREEECI